MKLVKTDGHSQLLEYPYSISSLQNDHPTVSFPSPLTQDDLTAFNCFIVTETKPSIEYDSTAYDLKSVASLINGAWVEQWSLVAVTEEETVRRTYEQLRKLDYRGFWKEFTRSASYAALKTAALTDLTSNVLATELISVFADAKAGNLDSEAMALGINEALTALQSIDPALVVETETLLAAYGLDVFTS